MSERQRFWIIVSVVAMIHGGLLLCLSRVHAAQALPFAAASQAGFLPEMQPKLPKIITLHWQQQQLLTVVNNQRQPDVLPEIKKPELESIPEPEPTPEPEPIPQPKPEPIPEPEPTPKVIAKLKPVNQPAVVAQKAGNPAGLHLKVTALQSNASDPKIGNGMMAGAGGEGSGGSGDTLADHRGGYLNNPRPIYPLLSRQNREEGTVTLQVMVEKDGRPSNVKIVRSSGHSRLDRSALITVTKSYRFRPATHLGQPVRSRYQFNIVFKLTQ